MPELRIILLVAGVLFIAGIAGYEWWRSRGSRPLATISPRDDGTDDMPARPVAPVLPEMNAVREARTSVPDTLPIIDLRTAEKSSGAGGGISVSEDVAVDRPHEITSTQAILRAHDEPRLGEKIGEFDEISEVRTIDTRIDDEA